MEVSERTSTGCTGDASNPALTNKNRGGRPSVYRRKLLQLESASVSVSEDCALDGEAAANSNGTCLKTKSSTSYHCGVCGKELSTKEGLLNHGSIHTGEKPFACQFAECGKAFRTKSDRSKHHKTHEGTKAHNCDECLTSFTTQTNLKTHQKVAHSEAKKFECATCQKTFGYLTNYRNHLLIHTGEKPYICSYTGCEQRFTEYSTALRHALRKHASDGAFQCPSCEKCYRTHSSLRHHQKSVHDKVLVLENSRSQIRMVSPSNLDVRSTMSEVLREEISYFSDLIHADNPFVFSMSAEEEKETAVLMGLYDGECEDEVTELRKQMARAEHEQVFQSSTLRKSAPTWDLGSTCDEDLFPELTATASGCCRESRDQLPESGKRPKRARKL